LVSTDINQNIISVNLEELNIQENFQYEQAFYKLTFCKELNELILLNEKGIFLFKIEIHSQQKKRGQVTSVRYISFEDYVVQIVKYSPSTFLFVTESDSLYHFTPLTKGLEQIDSFQLPSPFLSNAFSIT
jgi:hypothetical protein